jgi:hypothetical protein
MNNSHAKCNPQKVAQKHRTFNRNRKVYCIIFLNPGIIQQQVRPNGKKVVEEILKAIKLTQRKKWMTTVIAI